MSLTSLSATKLSTLIKKKEIKAEEITLAYLERIKEQEKDLSAFITVLEERALASAKSIDQKKQKGNLAGIPALALPVGLSKENLPLGIQIMANFFQETCIFKLAFLLEKKVKFDNNKLNLQKKEE